MSNYHKNETDIAEHLDNDHAIRSEKRPVPVRRPRGGRAYTRIAVSEKNSELNQNKGVLLHRNQMSFKKPIFMLWGHIPVKLRRGVAHFIISLLSPKPGPAPSVDIAGKQLPKIIVGFLSSPSGLGQAARLTADALTNEGYTVYGIDLSRYFYELADGIVHDLPDGRLVTGPAHVIININAPTFPMHCLRQAEHLSGINILQAIGSGRWRNCPIPGKRVLPVP